MTISANKKHLRINIRLIITAIMLALISLPSYSLVNNYPAQTMFYYKERGGAIVLQIFFYDEPTEPKTLAVSVGLPGIRKGLVWSQTGSTWDLFQSFSLGMKHTQTPYGLMPSGQMVRNLDNNDMLLVAEGFETINLNGTIYDLCDKSEYDNFMRGMEVMNSGIAPSVGGSYSSGSSSGSSSTSSAHTTCRICHGNGKCTSCNGKGISLYGAGQKACATCNGNGRCFNCHGTGQQ